MSVVSAGVNPYQWPSEYVADDSSREHGAWSHGDRLLVDRRSYKLPDRCLICNAPAYRKTYGLQLTWLPDSARGIAAAFHIAGPLAFILVMILFERSARLRVPFCSHHVWRRRRAVLFGWLSFPIALVLIAICVKHHFFQEWLVILLGLAGAAGTIFGYSTFVGPKAVRIDRRFVLMERISPGFLDNVPRAPIGESP